MFSKVETSLLPLYQYQMKFDVSPIMVTGNWLEICEEPTKILG
jgi:hypothetical protein